MKTLAQKMEMTPEKQREVQWRQKMVRKAES